MERGSNLLMDSCSVSIPDQIQTISELFEKFAFSTLQRIPTCCSSKLIGWMSERRYVYVGGLDDQANKDIVYSLFIPFGEILDVQFPVDEMKKHRGFAVVEFELIEDAEAAIENMHHSELFGKVLTVNIARSFVDQRLDDGANFVTGEDAIIETN